MLAAILKIRKRNRFIASIFLGIGVHSIANVLDNQETINGILEWFPLAGISFAIFWYFKDKNSGT